MYSGYYPIDIYQGANFSQQFVANDLNGNPINFSGYSGFCGLKYHFSDSGIFGSLNVSFPSSGIISLDLPASGTANFTGISQAIYEIDIASPSGNISRYINSYANIFPQLTRWP